MPDYKAVKSSLEISRTLTDCLEDIDPIQYNGRTRARGIRNINDFLQGRNDMPLEALLDWAARTREGAYAARVQDIRRSIQDFQAQRALLKQPYTKSSSKQYPYQTIELDRPLKVIDQRLYDWAAKAGFPPDFFRESYFDRVTLYCLPDRADCNFSVFQDCTFAVCRIQDTRLDGARIHSSEFHSCAIGRTTFFSAVLDHTHFRDCSMDWVSFQMARLIRCDLLDCKLAHVGFFHTYLDGCSAGRCQASHTRHLAEADVTMGGATEEEARDNRAALLRELGGTEARERPRPPKARDRER